MPIDSRMLFNALTTAAATSGYFDNVTGHEPRSAPALSGVSCSVWVVDLRPVQSSGLTSVSMRLEFQMRVYTSMLQEPADTIDWRVLDAVDQIMTKIVTNFDMDLTPDVRYVDLLGSDGEPLRAVAGYLSQDKALFRVMDVFVPVIINDAYVEVA